MTGTLLSYKDIPKLAKWSEFRGDSKSWLLLNSSVWLSIKRTWEGDNFVWMKLLWLAYEGNESATEERFSEILKLGRLKFGVGPWAWNLAIQCAWYNIWGLLTNQIFMLRTFWYGCALALLGFSVTIEVKISVFWGLFDPIFRDYWILSVL